MKEKSSAKPSKDVIYVDPDDEITSIIDKIENSTHKVTALVLPKRAASLQSIVNMKLLKRSADTAGKNVVLITSEQALLPLAGAAGLHVAKNLQSAPEVPSSPAGAGPAAAAAAEEAAEVNEEDLPAKFDYDRPVGALADRYESDNPETIDLDDDEDDKEAKAAAPAAAAGAAKSRNKVSVPNFDRFRMMLGLGGAALIALIVFIILAIFVLPKAKITVHTSSEPVNANFNLTASDKAPLDPAGGTLPAKLESTDQTGSQQVTATGQQNNGDKATGSVSMSTCVTGSSPNDVPAGTGVSTNGLSYITQQAAHFSPTFQVCGSGSGVLAKSNSVDINANAAGSKYNVSGASFSVAGRSDVSASGSASGGTDDIATILSQHDVDSAKQKLTSGSGSSDQFAKQFEDKLASQGEYVLVSTLKADDPAITSTPSVGQPASTAQVSIKITYHVLTVRKDDLKKVIQAQLADQVDKAKQKLSDSFMDDANVTVQSQKTPTDAVLQVSEDTTAVPIIDTASVKKLAAGKKSGDIKAALNNWAGVKSVDVKLSPFWVSKAPGNTSKITVVLTQDKSGSEKSAP
jgi:hypothetical protein